MRPATMLSRWILRFWNDVRGRATPALAAACLTVAFAGSPLHARRVEDAKLLPADAAHTNFFGTAIDIDGDVAVIGAQSDSQLGWGTGAAYVFRRVGRVWVEEQKLTPSDTPPVARFGTAVAVSGKRILVGAPGDVTYPATLGAVYAYRFDGARWVEDQKINGSPTGSVNDHFGTAVAVSGSTAVIGAPRADAACTWNAHCDSGAIHVYDLAGMLWVRTTTLLANDRTSGDLLGAAVAIDGARIVAGAPEKATGSARHGAAYVFERGVFTWAQSAKLAGSNGGPSDAFGASVAVAGVRVAVGAPGEANAGVASGGAYIFRDNGSWWTLERKLLSSDIASRDAFGTAVAANGDVVVVTAMLDAHSGRSERGSAYLYRRAGTAWVEESKLIASDLTPLLGNAVAVDDETVFLGASRDHQPAPYAGSVFVYGPPCGGIPTPFDVTAAVLAATTIRVDWQADSTDIASFRVERAVTGGPWVPIGVVSAGSNSGVNAFAFKDTSAVAESPLCYRVTARHIDGTLGCPSASSCAMTFAIFLRGDVDLDAKVGMSDLAVLSSILAGKSEALCADAADVDDDGRLTEADFAALAGYVYDGGTPPAKPFPDCGPDPSEDEMGCNVSACGE